MVSPLADIRLSDSLDALFVTPRPNQEPQSLMRLLKLLLPDSTLKRTADGISISSDKAIKLLNAAEGQFAWSSDTIRFISNREYASRSYPSLHSQLGALKEGGEGVANVHLKDRSDLSTLDAHQLVNVAAMTLRDGFGLCVFDEQGAGKTVSFIYAFDTLVARDEVDFALIVAPKSMVGEWPKDFLKFKRDLYKVSIMSGSGKQKRTTLYANPDVIVTNFETVISMEEQIKAILRRRDGRAVLAIDESFFIKSPDAKRTRALKRLREWCGRAYVLCGTPAPNSPHDLVQQFNIVDFGMTFNGLTIPDDREEALPIIKAAVDERGLFIRHLKVDVLPDLPSKSFHKILVPLQPLQKQLYESVLNNLISDVRAVDDKTFKREYTSFLARRMALLQICSSPSSVEKLYDETPAKIIALDRMLEELIRLKGEKVILWSFYTAAITAMCERYAKFNVVRYDGTVGSIEERREAVRKFQEDNTTMLFIANPAAAGAGLTLHKARYAIYESMSNQAAHYLQSLDRIHRRGQLRKVEYFILLCEGTIEVQEYERLLHKERAAQSLFGDNVAIPTTREAFLNEAMEAATILQTAARATV